MIIPAWARKAYERNSVHIQEAGQDVDAKRENVEVNKWKINYIDLMEEVK